jgi:hypothetical protein
MKQNMPSGRFEEQEADKLIAAFGVKPPADKRQEMEKLLREQKGKFLEQERSREAGKHRER